jgi:hypothetical protein
MAMNPGKRITEHHVASLVNQPYQKAATIAVAVSGFRSAGIFPLNRDMFTDADFSTAITTERPYNEHAVPVVGDRAATADRPIPTTPVTNRAPSMSIIGDVCTNGNVLVTPVRGDNHQLSAGSYISPIQLQPYPSASRPLGLTSTRKRTALRAQIITASPFKNELISKQMAKDDIQKKKE